MFNIYSRIYLTIFKKDNEKNESAERVRSRSRRLAD